MATWGDLHAHIDEHYEIDDEGPGWVKMVFDVGEGRSQIVLVSAIEVGDTGEEWVAIESPVGAMSEVPLERMLGIIEGKVCGGATAMDGGEVVGYRHALPLADLQTPEFENPLAMVTMTADQLERELLGHDVM